MAILLLQKFRKNEAHAKNIGIEVEFKQSNVEGEIVNYIQEAKIIIKV